MSVIDKRVRIDAPPEKVWAVLADFGRVADWAPTVERSTCREKNQGLGARRVLTLPSGETTEEVIVAWEEGHGFTFEIPAGLKPVRTLQESWSATPAAAGTIVCVAMRYKMRFGLIGALLDPLVVRPILRRMLVENLAGLKHYLETGELVTAQTKGLPVEAVE